MNGKWHQRNWDGSETTECGIPLSFIEEKGRLDGDTKTHTWQQIEKQKCKVCFKLKGGV